MLNKGVRRKSERRNTPPNKRLIESKLVFKKKRDGQFRLNIVVLGYTQISGVDFNKNYSSVVNDVTLRIILIIWLVNKWDSHTIDSRTAFYMQYYMKKYT